MRRRDRDLVFLSPDAGPERAAQRPIGWLLSIRHTRIPGEGARCSHSSEGGTHHFHFGRLGCPCTPGLALIASHRIIPFGNVLVSGRRGVDHGDNETKHIKWNTGEDHV